MAQASEVTETIHPINFPLPIVDNIAYPVNDAEHYAASLSLNTNTIPEQPEVCLNVNGQLLFAVDLKDWLALARQSLEKFSSKL